MKAVDHELVHGLDLANGNFDTWDDRYGETMAKNIAEYHALESTVTIEYGFGGQPGPAAGQFNNALNIVPLSKHKMNQKLIITTILVYLSLGCNYFCNAQTCEFLLAL